MKNQYVINALEIRRNLQNKHSEFIDNFGSYLDKIAAEEELKETLILSRLRLIVSCFKSEKILSVIEECDCGFILGCKGDRKRIIIETNGITLAIKGGGFLSPHETYKRFYNVYKEDFDWTDFASQLLDVIHSVIYERKLAAETKLQNEFSKK